MVEVRCACGKVGSVPRAHEGKAVRCPACKGPIHVPGSAGSVGSAGSTAAATTTPLQARVTSTLVVVAVVTLFGWIACGWAVVEDSAAVGAELRDQAPPGSMAEAMAGNRALAAERAAADLRMELRVGAGLLCAGFIGLHALLRRARAAAYARAEVVVPAIATGLATVGQLALAVEGLRLGPASSLWKATFGCVQALGWGVVAVLGALAVLSAREAEELRRS